MCIENRPFCGKLHVIECSMKAERGKNILGSLNRGSSWVRSTMIPTTFQKEIKCSTAYGIKKRFQLKDFWSRKILLRQHCLQSHQQADTNNFFYV